VKTEISSAPYDAVEEWKGAQYHRKGDEIISFEQKVKIQSVLFGN